MKQRALRWATQERTSTEFVLNSSFSSLFCCYTYIHMYLPYSSSLPLLPSFNPVPLVPWHCLVYLSLWFCLSPPPVHPNPSIFLRMCIHSLSLFLLPPNVVSFSSLLMTQMYRIYGNSQEFEMYRLQDSLQSNPDSIKVKRTLLNQAQHVLWLGCACMC